MQGERLAQPVVLRDADSAAKLSIDRYDIIRARQQEAQPTPNVLVPISESPVIPQRAPSTASAPMDPPPPSAEPAPRN